MSETKNSVCEKEKTKGELGGGLYGTISVPHSEAALNHAPLGSTCSQFSPQPHTFCLTVHFTLQPPDSRTTVGQPKLQPKPLKNRSWLLLTLLCLPFFSFFQKPTNIHREGKIDIIKREFSYPDRQMLRAFTSEETEYTTRWQYGIQPSSQIRVQHLILRREGAECALKRV